MQQHLLLEGWRAIHHSYALVAQAHCLCLLRRPGLVLRFRDLPYYYDTWRRTRGLFDAADEARLEGIPQPEPGFTPDVTLTMQAERADFSAPPAGRRFVFGTPEHRVLPHPSVIGIRSAAEVTPQVEVVTPSHWTAVAYARFGFAAERIHVVPHGIDPALVHPDDAGREAARAALGVQDDFVFASIGAMTPNKGIALLLSAFAVVAAETPRARLLLKGADALYPSRAFLNSAMDTLPGKARATVASRLLYHGSTLSARQMAAFVRAADCYVAPYFAEGFNLPALEAVASGVALICTAGGPTDDFTDPSFASRIRSRVVPAPLEHGQTGEALLPDHADLVDRMRAAIRDPEGTRSRGAEGARYVAARYTWERVTDILLEAFFGADPPPAP